MPQYITFRSSNFKLRETTPEELKKQEGRRSAERKKDSRFQGSREVFSFREAMALVNREFLLQVKLPLVPEGSRGTCTDVANIGIEWLIKVAWNRGGADWFTKSEYGRHLCPAP